MNAIKSFIFFAIAVLCLLSAFVMAIFSDNWDVIFFILVLGVASVLTSAYYGDYGNDE